MDTHTLGWSEDVEQAAWIEPRLSPFGSGLTTSVIPAGFPAYARLLHPVTFEAMEDQTVRWTQVAAWSGQPLDRLSQFPDIAMPEHLPAAEAPWDSQGPPLGSLSADDTAALVQLLNDHTSAADDAGSCWFCLWTGYSWEHAAIPASVREGQRVQLPGRDYFLFSGPIEAATVFVPEYRQTPNLWWSADRSWCVASEIDLPWTYLAGSSELIEHVLQHPDLEALPASADDRATTLRAPAWLEPRLHTAVDELLQTGETDLTTSAGTAYGTLRTPTRLRQGRLRINCRRTLCGATSTIGSETTLRWEDLDQLRETTYIHLLHITLAMVNN